MLTLADLLTATLPHQPADIAANTQAGGIIDLVHVQRRVDVEEARRGLAQGQSLDRVHGPQRSTSRTEHICTCRCTHPCTYTHVHTPMYIHPCTYTHAHTPMHIHPCTYTHGHAPMYMHPCTYTHAQTPMHIHPCTYTHALAHTCACIRMHACMHTRSTVLVLLFGDTTVMILEYCVAITALLVATHFLLTLYVRVLPTTHFQGQRRGVTEAEASLHLPWRPARGARARALLARRLQLEPTPTESSQPCC